ncbi:GYD domain-containing protein [Saccharopolyspora sp. 5N708]|uniref:GYD domain-containing protein n=1 Tax=Saccharopolyspora sp. 5N708 TaxID=3457424 RepID=UPI003FD52615
MGKYLVQASYTSDGLTGLFKEGGSARVEAVRKMLTRLDGTLESFYFAFGETDTYLVIDVPDNVSAASVGLTVSQSGAARTKTTVLLTPTEIDEAIRKDLAYQPPGS